MFSLVNSLSLVCICPFILSAMHPTSQWLGSSASVPTTGYFTGKGSTPMFHQLSSTTSPTTSPPTTSMTPTSMPADFGMVPPTFGGSTNQCRPLVRTRSPTFACSNIVTSKSSTTYITTCTGTTRTSPSCSSTTSSTSCSTSPTNDGTSPSGSDTYDFDFTTTTSIASTITYVESITYIPHNSYEPSNCCPSPSTTSVNHS